MKEPKRYYPYGDFFIDEVKKANQFLLDLNCSMDVHLGEWEASVKYKNSELYVKHQFGDREIVFETHVGTSRLGFKTYGLWEWKEALGIPWPDEIGDTIVHDELNQKTYLSNLIHSSADFIQAHLNKIIYVKWKVKRKLFRNRKKRIEQLRKQGFVISDK